MPRVITLANQKGGVGKSTLALNLYSCFQSIGKQAALIDLDPQGSLSDFAQLQQLPLLTPPANLQQLHSTAPYTEQDFLLIDTPPYLSGRLPEAVRASDLVLVPCSTGIPDALAVEHTLSFLREARSNPNTPPIALVLNRGRHATRSFVRELRKTLERYPEPVLQTLLHERIAYGRSPLHGGLFTDPDDNSEKARTEFRALVAEVLGLLA